MKHRPFFIALIYIFMSSACNNTTHIANTNLISFNWKKAAKLPDSPNGNKSLGLAGPIVGISNDHLIIGGGSNFPNGAPWDGGKKVYYSELYVYEKLDDSVQLVKKNFQLPIKLAYSANCSGSKGMVIAGGENENGPSSQCILINWDNQKATLLTKQLPDLPEPLSSGAACMVGDSVYFLGGVNNGQVSNRFYCLNLMDLGKGWKALTPFGKEISYTLLLPIKRENKDYLYVAGGRKMHPDSTSDLYKSVYQFDIKEDKWSKKSDLPYAISAHTGIAVSPDNIYIFGGDKGVVFHQTELLLMDISKEKDPQKKQELILQKNDLQLNHPGFSREILDYDIAKDQWKIISNLPFGSQVTTTAVKWRQDLVIPCGEIRAGVRSADIEMGQLQ